MGNCTLANTAANMAPTMKPSSLAPLSCLVCSAMLAFALLLSSLQPALGVDKSAGAGTYAGGQLRLIMFDEIGCPYCRLWEAQVGQYYPNTPIGRRVPLVKSEISSGEFSFIKGVVYTPTFVLLRGDKELGRITGYPGEEFFWAYLQSMVERAGVTLADRASAK